MARSSRASSRLSWPRVLHPLYYLRRPRRLFILLGFFLATTFLLWNQHKLPVLQQQQQQQKLTSELIEQDLQQLSKEVDELSSILIYKATKDMEFAGDAKNLGNESDSEHDPVTVWRRQQVKAAMLHAWSSYEKYAWGFDELQVSIILSPIICLQCEQSSLNQLQQSQQMVK
jgi:mannosyl-oligosaccharide alpha-1,2-mannosidase